MSNSVLGLSIDCADAAGLARFWADVLGRPVSPQPTAEFAAIAASEPKPGPPLAFHQVPEAKTVKNRLHLDLISDDFAAESDRLLSLGATRVTDVETGGARWTTFRDPEGNEFDLVAG
ncbi:VOC family protein [Amycolatopsis sp. NBC_00345]|uniref:VOC family protein n=1 Tax=Amycolatopsis sp. NBC_00345 TaxID=2975955 RepID=UPI002E26F1D1